jgi:hypothetical protein
MDLDKLRGLLRRLQAEPLLEVAFVTDEAGGLLAWAGASRAFSPTGLFTPREPDEEDQDLYLCALGQGHFLGVLLAEGADVSSIRALLRQRVPALEQALAQPGGDV